MVSIELSVEVMRTTAPSACLLLPREVNGAFPNYGSKQHPHQGSRLSCDTHTLSIGKQRIKNKFWYLQKRNIPLDCVSILAAFVSPDLQPLGRHHSILVDESEA